ncbi:CHASE2 domain-containing protein [Rhodoferax saidenbachensis]|uniref:Adenylate/guanylate cyclase domain-containing protein n=1 Tax=Rhodoferax saidenbachensis TaxID=1484693 RepID=A0A1P8KEN0_9BURK|nr:adenylate/guanylate cyclase domain-containing protein [Rhodoferax saidenbachensis]APW44483.1 adenylate/guanylate cyclase domain-containing protein [Rhodoferax saidenbachensis]
MKSIAKHWPRIAVTLLPLVFALLHAVGVVRLDVLQRLDDIIYDARLRATSPKTLDDRIVIVDIDEKSLAEVGRWPWGRNKLGQLVSELFDQQQIALLGFDVVFAEADESSGLVRLNAMAQNEFKDQAGFSERLRQLQATLDYDAVFASALAKRPVVMGYYLTSDRHGHSTGVLPTPIMSQADLQGRAIRSTSWSGYGSNIAPLAKAAPMAGFFNSITDGDGVVRSLPLIAEYKGDYYESLGLSMFRALAGHPAVLPGFSNERFLSRSYQGMDRVLLKQGDKSLAIPVDERVATLVPFRGAGGVDGGSFRYVSASDILAKRITPGSLKDKIVLVGTTAPGLLDLRVTPVGETYPGVETHANLISGLLDGNVLLKPDYALGYDVVMLVLAGLVLAIGLPLLSAPRAVALSVGVLLALAGINFWLYLSYGLVLPLASSLTMALTAFALNMSYGYFVESRSKRELAQLFGTYVPPELVDEMVKDPDSYTMQAANRELTVMFCDMRGFTKMSEQMEPLQLQALLTGVFSRLTSLIRANRGTIDKYMGDCVMAFWGAPVESAEHAHLAVKSAMEMANAVRDINHEHRAQGLPEIGIGIGLNTGTMCVGDMGSNIRRSYTVIGDAVNLGSRLEGLSKAYGVDIVVSESTRKLAPDFAWQELDRVRVKGKEQAVAIFWPLAPAERLNAEAANELKTWANFIKTYRSQNWDQADVLLLNLMRMNVKKYLYQLYSERVASMRLLPFDPEWDGATNFETK